MAVAAPESYAAAVTAAGLHPPPFADAPPELIGPVMGRLPTLGFDEANETVIREVFARIDAQAALPGVTAAIDAWHPDVVLREPAELGSLAAAERAGVPHAQVAIGMLEVCELFARLVPEPLAELDRLTGLPDGRSAGALASETVLTSVPESWTAPLAPERRPCRPTSDASATPDSSPRPASCRRPGATPTTRWSMSPSAPSPARCRPSRACSARRSTRWPTSPSGC